MIVDLTTWLEFGKRTQFLVVRRGVASDGFLDLFVDHHEGSGELGVLSSGKQAIWQVVQGKREG